MARLKVRRYAIGALTFSFALGLGFIVQYGDAVASRSGSSTTVAASPQSAALLNFGLKPATAQAATPQGFNLPEMPTLERSAATIDDVPSELTAPKIILPSGLQSFQSSELDTPLSDIIFTSLSNDSEMGDRNLTDELNASNCEVTGFAHAANMAMVQISIDAPCRQNELFTVHHQGMSFEMYTDDLGLANFDVPALDENAVFLASFEDGKSLMLQTDASDFGDYDRAVLISSVDNDVQLHAREFGADYWTMGHVWRGDTGQFAGAITGVNGLLSELGSGKLRAEVYTFPTSHGVKSGNVVLSVEVEVTEKNCGHDIFAQTLQFAQGSMSQNFDIEFALPGCDAIGEFIVLKNAFEDLTLAQR